MSGACAERPRARRRAADRVPSRSAPAPRGASRRCTSARASRSVRARSASHADGCSGILATCASGRSSGSATQRSKATRNTAMPASAARLASGSVTPRRRSPSASAVARDAILISSRSLQLGVGGDDGLPLPGVVAVLTEQLGGRVERGRDGAHRRRGGRRGLQRGDQAVLQRLRPGEQHLALVGEVPEERPRGQSGPVGDLGHGGLLVPALDVQLHRCLAEPTARVRLPSTHGRRV